ncbi:cyclin-D2-1-like [Curcuma longa]|uniref:cyclin-D2-1-like n=1 Tax=Curcuma longa TaxID=136217 RepID=UPI003D9EC604
METCSILSLLCDEEPFFGTPIASPQTSPQISSSALSISPSPQIVSRSETESFLLDLLEREHIYAPCRGYRERLHQTSDLPLARNRAIRYIISVCRRLNLGVVTAFNAVNYLDRFISMNSSVKWEEWMMELLSIACLSIASKMDEVSVPPLHDLQMEDLARSFEPTTIQQMELTVLKRLDWRLASVTPYTYFEAITWGWQLHRACAVELLVAALLDGRFLGFKASSVAVSALQTVEGGGATFAALALSVEAHAKVGRQVNEVAECQRMMRDLFRRTPFRREKTTTNVNIFLLSSKSAISMQTDPESSALRFSAAPELQGPGINRDVNSF